MKVDSQNFWNKKHDEYVNFDWIDKTSIFAQQILKYLPKGGKLLDLGAGQGQDSRFFAKKGFDVLCADFSENALGKAKDKASKEGLKMEFTDLDLSNELPFGDNEFEVIYAHMSLHYWNHKETQRLFDDIYRILRKGGIFACLLNSDKDPEIPEFQKIDDILYLDPKGLLKSYFSSLFLKQIIDDKYDILILDDRGETYKDRIKTLTRFVGIKK